MSPAMSAYLDLWRLLAAVVVFLVHVDHFQIGGRLPGLWRFPGIGHDAVLVFFVLSGYVIAYVRDRKTPALGSYCIDRLARLYSVIVPALLITVAADSLGRSMSSAIYEGPLGFSDSMPVVRLLASLLFLNELWFMTIRPLSNLPFWSLGYEAWYYAIFGAWSYLRGRSRYVVTGILVGIVGPKIALLLPVWLLGVLAYRLSLRRPPSRLAAWALAAVPLAAYGLFRGLELPVRLLASTREWLGPTFHDLAWSQTFVHAYIVGLLIALHFIGVAWLLRGSQRRLPAVSYLASFTFVLYLLHYPLLYFFGGGVDRLGIDQGRTAVVVGGVILVVWAVGLVTERSKHGLRHLLARVTAHDTVRSPKR
jgi:peptidoglycan/LPS O-acetylase OafA/YrhL